MKFWYHGQLVRTSKGHDYNFAVVEQQDDGTLRVFGCRADRKAAEAEASYQLKYGHLGIRVVRLDKGEAQPAALTYEQFMALARANYNKGGDGYVECWDDRTFAYYVHEFGPITEAGALEMFDTALDEEREERAMAQAAMKGEL